MKLVSCGGGDALALGNGYAGDPDDFLLVANQGQGVTLMSRNMGVDENILETLGLPQPERAHAVARPPDRHHQRLLDEVAVEVTHLISGPEGCRIATAGFDPQLRRRRGGGGAQRLAASERFDLEEAGVGNQPADDAPLEGRRQSSKRVAIAREGAGQPRNLCVEKAVLFTEDVGGPCQQIPRGWIEGVDRGEDLLPQAIAGETWVVVAGVAQRGQLDLRQIGLDLRSRDVEERPRKGAVPSSHGAQPSRAAASKEME